MGKIPFFQKFWGFVAGWHGVRRAVAALARVKSPVSRTARMPPGNRIGGEWNGKFSPKAVKRASPQSKGRAEDFAQEDGAAEVLAVAQEFC